MRRGNMIFVSIDPVFNEYDNTSKYLQYDFCEIILQQSITIYSILLRHHIQSSITGVR